MNGLILICLVYAVFVNGIICKDPKLVNSSDFVFEAKMNIKGSTLNPSGLAINAATVTEFPALNTLGLSLARVDYAPNGGFSAPHIHPRASELLVLVEGTLLVGFVTSNPGYKLFSTVLKPGDVFVFPKGLVHFQYNVGRTPAFAFVAFGNQNPGIILIPKAVFGSNPRSQRDVLLRAFQVNPKVIDQLQAQFGS